MGFSKINWSNFRFTREQVKSYAVDWVVLTITVILGGVAGKIHPFQRLFSVDDLSISYPYSAKETLSETIVIVISLSVATFIVLFWAIITSNGRTFHHGLLSLLTGNSLTLLFVRVCKIGAGRLRPDFLARCNPDKSKISLAIKLYDVSICKETNTKLIHDGFKSFFSGHAATAFASFMFLSLFLAGKLRVLDGKGHIVKLFIVILPLLAASYISFTRLHDYRHHWEDLLGGCIFGSFLAIITYFQYFPSLFACDPYPLQCRLKPSPDKSQSHYSTIPPPPKIEAPIPSYNPNC